MAARGVLVQPAVLQCASQTVFLSAYGAVMLRVANHILPLPTWGGPEKGGQSGSAMQIEPKPCVRNTQKIHDESDPDGV